METHIPGRAARFAAVVAIALQASLSSAAGSTTTRSIEVEARGPVGWYATRNGVVDVPPTCAYVSHDVQTLEQRPAAGAQGSGELHLGYAANTYRSASARVFAVSVTVVAASDPGVESVRLKVRLNVKMTCSPG